MSEKSDSFTKKSWRTIAQEQKIVRKSGSLEAKYTELRGGSRLTHW